MLATLTTSDIVAVLMGIVQIAASVLIAIWTVKRTTTSPLTPSAGRPVRNGFGLVASWFRGAWLFVAFFAFGSYQLWSLVRSDLPLSKQYLNLLLFFAFYCSINFGLAIAFFAFEAQMYMNKWALRALEELSSAQGKALELQREAVSITKEVIDVKTKSKGRRR